MHHTQTSDVSRKELQTNEGCLEETFLLFSVFLFSRYRNNTIKYKIDFSENYYNRQKKTNKKTTKIKTASLILC